MKKPLKFKVMDLLLELEPGNDKVEGPKARSPNRSRKQHKMSADNKNIMINEFHGSLVINLNQTQTVNSDRLIKEIDSITASLPESKRVKARRILLRYLSSIAVVWNLTAGVSS